LVELVLLALMEILPGMGQVEMEEAMVLEEVGEMEMDKEEEMENLDLLEGLEA